MIAGDAFPLREASLTSLLGKQEWVRRRHARRECLSHDKRKENASLMARCLHWSVTTPQMYRSPGHYCWSASPFAPAVMFWLKRKGRLLTRCRTVVVSSSCLLFQSLYGLLIVCRRLICRFFNITVNELHQRSFDLLSFYSLSFSFFLFSFFCSCFDLRTLLPYLSHSHVVQNIKGEKFSSFRCVFFSRSPTSKRTLDLPI